MAKHRLRWPIVFACTAAGAALGVTAVNLLRQQGGAAVGILADALVKHALLNGPVVATGISAAAAIGAAAIVPAIVVYALVKWDK